MPRYRSPNVSSISFGPGPISTALKALIGANVAMFLMTQLVPSLVGLLGLVPAYVLHNLWIWQLGTYMFLHGGIFHILFNMLALWMFGAELERVWGTRYFLKFYLVTGIGAGALTVAFSLLPFDFAQQLQHSRRDRRVGRGVRPAAGLRHVLPRSSDLHVLRLPDSGQDLRGHHRARSPSSRRSATRAAWPMPRTSAGCSWATSTSRAHG